MYTGEVLQLYTVNHNTSTIGMWLVVSLYMCNDDGAKRMLESLHIQYVSEWRLEPSGAILIQEHVVRNISFIPRSASVLRLTGRQTCDSLLPRWAFFFFLNSVSFPTLFCTWVGRNVLPSRFPTKTLYARLPSPIRATCPTHHTLL